MMEDGIVAVLKSPEGTLALELLIIVVLLFLWREIVSTRKALYRRIEGVQGNLHEHEKTCAKRWGRISERLKIADDD